MADTPGIVLLYEFDHVRNASVSGNLDIDQTEKNLCASLSLSLSLPVVRHHSNSLKNSFKISQPTLRDSDRIW